MPTIEKHGGLWFEDVESGYRLVFEHYEAAQELIAAVRFKAPNTYRASVFEKVEDPRFRLPFWSERRPDAMFSDESPAISHAPKLLIECERGTEGV